MVVLDCMIGTIHVIGDHVYRVVAYEVLPGVPPGPPTGAPVILLRLELVR